MTLRDSFSMYLTIFILFPSFALSSFVNLSTELSVAHLFTGVSWNIITAAVVAASSLFYICNRSFSLMGTPPGIPWAGNGQDVLSRARTTFRSVFGMRELIEEGYYKYSKREKPFILPNLITGPEIILPTSQLPWLCEQPDQDLSQYEVNRQFLQADNTMLLVFPHRDASHVNFIIKQMMKKIDDYAGNIVEEIKFALELNWGNDTEEWQEISVFATMLNIVTRVASMVLVGNPICRNEDYINSSSIFAKDVILTAGLLNILPSFLKPLFAPLITAYDRFHYRKIAKYINPVVKNRWSESQAFSATDGKPDFSQHNDYVQWALRDAFNQGLPSETEPPVISKRLAILGFASIQSTVPTTTNVLFDIAASTTSIDLQKTLREEISTLMRLASTDGIWKRPLLNDMIHFDSAVRESIRLNHFVSRGVMKMVVRPEGISLQSGEHVPVGMKIGVTGWTVHHDKDIYEDAYGYHAFRFCKAAKVKDGLAQSSVKSSKGSADQPAPLVSTSENFMGFSHGKHACPGRFFAALVIKLLLAQIVLNYDIEPLEERPTNHWFNNSIGPPIWSKIRIRRRKHESCGKTDV